MKKLQAFLSISLCLVSLMISALPTMAGGDPDRDHVYCDKPIALIQCGNPTDERPEFAKLVVNIQRCWPYERSVSLPYIQAHSYLPMELQGRPSSLHVEDRIMSARLFHRRNEIVLMKPASPDGSYPYIPTIIRVDLNSQRGEGKDATYTVDLSHIEGGFRFDGCKLAGSPENLVKEMQAILETLEQAFKKKDRRWWPF